VAPDKGQGDTRTFGAIHARERSKKTKKNEIHDDDSDAGYD